MAKKQIGLEQSDFSAMVEEANKQANTITPLVDYEPISSPEELERLSIESLSIMIQRNKGDLKALGAIREVLDRVQGKPVQRAVNANLNTEQPFKIEIVRYGKE